MTREAPLPTKAKGSKVSVTNPPDASPPQDNVLTEAWLRRNGYILAADERARQMRMARAALDELLYGDAPRSDAA